MVTSLAALAATVAAAGAAPSSFLVGECAGPRASGEFRNLCRVDLLGRSRAITSAGALDGSGGYDLPALSADGSRLAYALRGAIHLGGADPRNAPVLVPGEGPRDERLKVEDLELDAAGSRVLFLREGPGDAEVADAGGVKTVARGATAVTWLDGRPVAAIAAPPRSGERHCLLVPDAGTCERTILPLRARDAPHPAVSPDGRRVAVIAESRRFDSGVLRIYSARTGRRLRELLVVGSDAGLPAWSPDGRSIAYATQRGTYIADVGIRRAYLHAPGVSDPTWGGRIGSRNPRLRVTSVRRRGLRLHVRGTVRRATRAPVLVAFESSGGDAIRRMVPVRPRGGRFAAIVRGLQDDHSRCELDVTFTGDPRFHRAAWGRSMKDERCAP